MVEFNNEKLKYKELIDESDKNILKIKTILEKVQNSFCDIDK